MKSFIAALFVIFILVHAFKIKFQSIQNTLVNIQMTKFVVIKFSPNSNKYSIAFITFHLIPCSPVDELARIIRSTATRWDAITAASEETVVLPVDEMKIITLS